MASRIYPRAASVLVFLSLAACAAVSSTPPRQGPEAAVLAGRVTFRGEPFQGGEVGVYPTLADYREGRAIARFSPTPSSGAFRLLLSPGKYYLGARGRHPDDESSLLFNFHGSNPVDLMPGSRATLVLALVPQPPPPVFVDNPGWSGAGLAGVLLHEGKPLGGGSVFVYLGGEVDLRGTPYAVSPPTGEDGRFSLTGLVETEYHVLARKRAGRRLAGPVRPGDFSGYYAFNPLRLEQGREARIELELIEKADEPGKEGSGHIRGRTRIEGRIIDTAGRPRPGAYAFVYPDRIMSHAKPAAISPLSGPDGRFVLNLEGGGRFYLGAREEYGINPGPGEYYGKYTGTPDHAVTVADGEIVREITIIVERVLE